MLIKHNLLKQNIAQCDKNEKNYLKIINVKIYTRKCKIKVSTLNIIVTYFKLCSTNISVKLKTMLYSTNSHKILHPPPDDRARHPEWGNFYCLCDHCNYITAVHAFYSFNNVTISAVLYNAYMY